MSIKVAPLILTAVLPPDVQSWATALRDAHYPAERNFLPAHVTLFRALPPSLDTEVRSLLGDLTGQLAAIPARLSGVMSLGNGAAIAIECPAMNSLWSFLAERFHRALTPQDTAQPRLHITIQNKVNSRTARALQERLAGQLTSRAFAFSGLALHRYRGGPWEAVHQWKFRGRHPVDHVLPTA